jgi:hypothetical protein
MLKQSFSWGIASLLSVLLAACGGGGGSPGEASATSAAQSLVVEGRTAPAIEGLELTGIRTRSAAEKLPVPTLIQLPALLAPQSEHDDGSGRYMISAPRDVLATSSSTKMQQHLNWRPLPHGGQSAAVSFSSVDAFGIRLGLLVRALPGSAQIRIYRQDKSETVYQISGQEILQRIQSNIDAGDTSDNARTWWSPDAGSHEVTLEIEIPPGTPSSAVNVAVPRLSHVFVPLELPLESEKALQAKINESGACNLDATCYDAYANQRNGIARMIYIENGQGYTCTGSLINDKASSGTPYFLTANHCISTQTAASTLQTDWFYRSPSCDSRTLSSATSKRVGGADLRFTSSAMDTTLLVLRDTPPAGVYFAGWDASNASAAVGTQVVGIHHPRGDLLKIALGSITGFTSCTTGANGVISCTVASSTANFYVTTWSQGVIESGSSGSPLLTQDGRYILGVLFAGNAAAACKADGTRNVSGPNIYGRFDIAYNAGLSQFLNQSATPNPTSARQAIYRFYNARTGAHFFTSSAAERDSVIQNLPAFAYEGVAFYAYPPAESGQSPVYRFYNTASAAHFYTINNGERDYVRASLRSYNYEGPTWSAQPTATAGTSPIYRFYRPGNNTHFYTISDAERDFVRANNPGYVYEGPAYYAWTGQ